MTPRFRFEPHVERLGDEAERLPMAELLARLDGFARPALLDSASGRPSRFSLLAFEPLALPDEIAPADLAGVRALLASLAPASPSAAELPFFAGGFLGALAYELGAPEECLDLPPDPLGLPRVLGGLYTDFLLRDHARGETCLVLGIEPGDGRPGVEERRARVLSALATPGCAGDGGLRRDGERTRLVTPAQHYARIERAREEIARGEVYQLNLTHRSYATLVGSPLALYGRLVAAHPGPYCGYLDAGVAQVLSGSPELLLEFEPGCAGYAARATTRPIKGTAPRAADADRDRELARALLASAKDHAELAMIVDLERNDLGRIARPAGVSAEVPFRLESYATVHHLLSDVTAEVDPRYDGLDGLATLFPGGSITGAPKLRAMELIAELEEEGRGLFYGSLVAADLAGRVHANLLIRTLVRVGAAADARAVVHYRVGGGITYASIAEEEEREAGWKGRALARLLDAP